MDAVVLHGSNPRKIQHFIISSHFSATGLLPQPPLLPLPTTSLRRSATMYPPVTKKHTNSHRTRDSSLTPKKSKHPKKEDRRSPKNPMYNMASKELPKDVAKVLPFIPPADMFSGAAAFAISPPPSSLPLPTFSLRPKMMSCKVEAAAGIDTGATDDLRRLLRLR